MEIDYKLIEYIKDEETVEEIKENEENVLENCEYLESLGFTDVGIILMHVHIWFILPPSDFKAFIERKARALGKNYVSLMNEDFEYWMFDEV